jgi:TonB family protein
MRAAAYSHSLSLPWSVSPEEERRFRRILGTVLLMTVALGLTVPLLPVIEKVVERQPALPPRMARLIFEKRRAPEPMPEPGAVEEPKPASKTEKKPVVQSKPAVKVVKSPRPEQKQPPVDALEQARRRASRAGLLAMQDSLADLRDQSVNELRGAKRLSNRGSEARKPERRLISSSAGSASQGIDTARLSRDAGSTVLASRTATAVKSTIARAAPTSRQRETKRGASRSIEEIQTVFDRHKSAIYILYNRALRTNPSLQGKLVLSLTIAPSGKVTAITLVSSELRDPALEAKLIRRIKMFDFGASPVETVTITYPIDFLPA